MGLVRKRQGQKASKRTDDETSIIYSFNKTSFRASGCMESNYRVCRVCRVLGRGLEWGGVWLALIGVQPFGVSVPRWMKSCLGPHIKYTATGNHKKQSHNVLSKFMILCWATFIAILACMWPVGRRLDTPDNSHWDLKTELIWVTLAYSYLT